MDSKYFSQFFQDKLAPFPLQRWIATGILVLFYICRICVKRTHAVVTYVAAVYLLHAFILFESPKDSNIPSFYENENIGEDDYNPSNIDNDFKPYVRKLPEFTFWGFTTQIIFAAFFLTFFEMADIPVFIPILAIYFVFILVMTLYKLVLHSRKFKYSLFWSRKSTLEQ